MLRWAILLMNRIVLSDKHLVKKKNFFFVILFSILFFLVEPSKRKENIRSGNCTDFDEGKF